MTDDKKKEKIYPKLSPVIRHFWEPVVLRRVWWMVVVLAVLILPGSGWATEDQNAKKPYDQCFNTHFSTSDIYGCLEKVDTKVEQQRVALAKKTAHFLEKTHPDRPDIGQVFLRIDHEWENYRESLCWTIQNFFPGSGSGFGPATCFIDLGLEKAKWYQQFTQTRPYEIEKNRCVSCEGRMMDKKFNNFLSQMKIRIKKGDKKRERDNGDPFCSAIDDFLNTRKLSNKYMNDIYDFSLIFISKKSFNVLLFRIQEEKKLIKNYKIIDEDNLI